MPHICIKAYPRPLSDQQKNELVDALNQVLIQHLGSKESSISIDYQEVPAEQWKNIYKNEIESRWDALLQKPQYTVSD